MDKIERNKKGNNGFLVLEIVLFIFALSSYTYISKDYLKNNQAIKNIVNELSISFEIVIIMRIITVILTVIISVVISSFVMTIFLNKFEDKDYNKKALKSVIYKSFLFGMIFNYLILIITYVMGITVNLNITSIISYAVISIVLGLLFNNVLRFKIKNIIIISSAFFVINSGAAILQLMKLI